MSKMRFSNKRALVVAVMLTALMAGCARVDVNSAKIRGVGYVRVDQVIKHDPLYPQLTKLNDAIAAVKLQYAGSPPPSTAGIAAQTTQLAQELKVAGEQTSRILAQTRADYEQRERAAIAAALAAVGNTGAGDRAGQSMGATSAAQAQAIAKQATQGFVRYQQSVVREDRATIAKIAHQIQLKAARKYQARVMEDQQREAQLSYSLSKQDAPKVVAIKTRLSNLALDGATKKRLQGELKAIEQRERAAIDAMRNRHKASLTAYGKQLQARTNAQVAQQAQNIQRDSQSKVAMQRDAVLAKLRALGPAPLPQNLSPATKAKIETIHHQFTGEFEAQAQKIIANYDSTKADIDRQYAALTGANAGATGAAGQELAKLERRRVSLYRQMETQVRNDAQRVARRLGLRVVFQGVIAASGGYDLTNQVTKDIESLNK
ncbi:MAG: hypothetical protein ACYDA5_00450 [Vulcanimicrobiaceae bacterium]